MSKKKGKKKCRKVVHKITPQQDLLKDLHTIHRFGILPADNPTIQSLIIGFMRHNGWTQKQEWLVKSLIEKSIKAELAAGGAVRSKRRILADRGAEVSTQDADMEVLAEARSRI